ncbi:MAG: hypothetical protein Q8P41_18345 [Pseudomonadota bacterium]|nr:hypothetical protein [Pseudomonadota bacterium]
MMDDLQFEKLDTIDAVIRQRCTEITHITVHEVLDRNGYPQLGRICFGALDLGAFIEPEADDATDDEDDEREDGEDNVAEGDTLGDLARTDCGVSYAVLADAALRWIKHMADQNMVGQREGKFKVNLWKGKGDKVIYSSRFLCTNTEYEEVPVVPAPTVALPTVLPDISPDPRTWRALGEGYQNFIALVQSSYQHLANLQNAHITSQSGQLARAQRTNENIVGQLTNLKIGAFEIESQQRGDDGEGRVREELGKQFIAELGGLGRVLATAKFGLAPEMIELAEIVNASPELLEAMKNPEVRKILRDEKTRKELAALLLMAAQAATAPPNPPPSGESAAA